VSRPIEERIPQSTFGSLQLLLSLSAYLSEEEQDILVQTISLAFVAHHGQKRKNEHQFIMHPLQVACFLADLHQDLSTLQAALLHDTLEVTPLSAEQIKRECGAEVLALVESVTHHKAFSNREFLEKVYNRSKENRSVAVIKLADRAANLMHGDQRVFSPEKHAEVLAETQQFYIDQLAALSDLPVELTRALQRITTASETEYTQRIKA